MEIKLLKINSDYTGADEENNSEFVLVCDQVAWPYQISVIQCFAVIATVQQDRGTFAFLFHSVYLASLATRKDGMCRFFLLKLFRLSHFESLN